MAQKHFVVHQNFIRRDDDTVFCKKDHKIEKLSAILEQCSYCPYIYGSLQGEGVECGWEDVVDVPFWTVSSPQEELLRVSKLIDENIVPKS